MLKGPMNMDALSSVTKAKFNQLASQKGQSLCVVKRNTRLGF